MLKSRYQNLTLEDAMRMRLQPDPKKRKPGQRSRWFSNLRHNGEKIQVSLDAYEHETKTAQINLGRLMADLASGVNPANVRKKIKKLKLTGKISSRDRGILEGHIMPFFGEYRPRDLNREIIERYFETRWARPEDEPTQSAGETINLNDKEA